MVEKSLEDIYKDIERETEEECFDKEDLKLKDQEPYAIVGRSISSGNILLKVGDELGYDVSKTLIKAHCETYSNEDSHYM